LKGFHRFQVPEQIEPSIPLLQSGARLYFDAVKPLLIADAESLKEGSTLKFEFHRGDKTVEGFVARFRGQLVAYENVCQHLPISLDYGDDRFFSRDGRYFICQTHGAIYEPLSGLCVRGPCEGDNLKPLEIEVRDGAIWLVKT